VQSNYNFQTQESINILKTKQNKTTITISQIAMQICTNYGRNEDMNKTEVNNSEKNYLTPK
jgi:hypothetical protein